MFPTVKYDMVANRFVPFVDYIDIESLTLTGAVAKMQVRERKNGGLVLADVTPVVTTFAAGGKNYSRITMSIPEATIEGFPKGPEPDDDVCYYYDVHLTPSGGTKFIPFAGSFTIKAGVTE